MHTDWAHLAEAFAVAVVLVFFTDWYFFGRPGLHRHYGRVAGVWKRYPDKKRQIRSISAFA